MRAFRFELEQLLRLRQWREEEAKKALAAEAQALEKLKARLGLLRGELGELLAAGARTPGQEADAFDFRGRVGLLGYARFLGWQIQGQEGEIAAQGERLKEKAGALMQAMQERKVLEKLKERRRAEHRRERNREDYAALDEASQKFLERNKDVME